MLVTEAKMVFRGFIEGRGKNPLALLPTEAFELVFEFFETVRADNALPICNREMGDALLFQWGIYPAFAGFNEEYFYVDLTRQFILQEGEDDDAIFQLMCTLKYSPNDQLRGIETGNRWCTEFADLPVFKKFVYAHPALSAVKTLSPMKVEIALNGM